MKTQQRNATELERAGATQAARSMRTFENLDAINEVQTVFANRIRTERPEIDTVLGNDTKPVDRLNFAKRHGYPLKTIMAEQQKTIEAESN